MENVSKLISGQILSRTEKESAILCPPKYSIERIESYQHFKEISHLLTVQPFKPELLIQLADMACFCYSSGLSYNKRLLFRTLRKYNKLRPASFILPSSQKRALFNLFQQESRKQGYIFKTVYLILSGQVLESDQIKWLKKNAFISVYCLQLFLGNPGLEGQKE